MKKNSWISKKLFMTLVPIIIGALVTLGKLTPEQATVWQEVILKGIGFVFMALVAFGYVKAQATVDVEKEKKKNE